MKTVTRFGIFAALPAVFVFVALFMSACGERQSPEPVGLPVGAASSVGATATPAALRPAPVRIVPTLPLPAPTLTQSAPSTSPSPDPLAVQTAVIEATRTAAAAPPTPLVFPSATAAAVATAATTGSLLTEPMPTPAGIYSRTLKVPILMYHYISEPPPDADIYRVDLSVPPAAFRQQMAYLRDNGYTTIDLYDLTMAITGQTELPQKPVLLTFDDGYLDNYEAAVPILREHGFEGTFFIVTEFIDNGREGYMTWPMIEEMARAGHRIEPHSRTHPHLIGMAHEKLIWEILGPLETLTAHIGYRPRYFCYPGGIYDETTIQMLQDLDFWGALTTENGNLHGFENRYEWHRARIRNSTPIEEFARLVDLESAVNGIPPG